MAQFAPHLTTIEFDTGLTLIDTYFRDSVLIWLSFNPIKDESVMAIPAYMWLKDDGGADIKGSSTVQGREGSIEVVAFCHGLNIPVDGHSGKITGVR